MDGRYTVREMLHLDALEIEPRSTEYPLEPIGVLSLDLLATAPPETDDVHKVRIAREERGDAPCIPFVPGVGEPFHKLFRLGCEGWRHHQFSPNGLTSTSKVQADRDCLASQTAFAAISSGWRKKLSGLSGMFWRVFGRSTTASMMIRAT